MIETTTSMVRLDMFKAPYAKKVAIIRAKLLPKGLYGCELGPINESAMQASRAATANCMTYSSMRRSTDLTFAMCSRGNDVDPDMEVVRRRILCFRRAMILHEGAEQMIQDIFNKYKDDGHPAIGEGSDDKNLSSTVLAGEPTSKTRGDVKKSM